MTQALQGPTLGVKRVISLGARVKGTSTSNKNSKHDPIPREQLLIPLLPWDRHNERCRRCNVHVRDSLLRTEVERRSQRGLLRADVESGIDPLLGPMVDGT